MPLEPLVQRVLQEVKAPRVQLELLELLALPALPVALEIRALLVQLV